MRLSNLLIASSCLLAQALALPSNPNGKLLPTQDVPPSKGHNDIVAPWASIRKKRLREMRFAKDYGQR
jgi:hypothetical protein